jgi:hypothetical protein
MEENHGRSALKQNAMARVLKRRGRIYIVFISSYIEESRDEICEQNGGGNNPHGDVALDEWSFYCPHCKKRHLRSVPFLKQFCLFTENSGKELNVKESSLKSSEEVFP